MDYEFFTVDVFTDQQFGGNQLAVLPNASGLDDMQMQRIATEFNYAESTFVLPPEDDNHTARIRIFTPAGEMPFAGHPNIGTTFVLAELNRLHADHGGCNGIFEEAAGLVEVQSVIEDGRRISTIRAPRGLDKVESLPAENAARTVGLGASDLCGLEPVYAESGVGYVVAEVANTETLSRTQADAVALAQTLTSDVGTGAYVFTRSGHSEGFDCRARMFAPEMGVVEDAATGSAACVLGALLALERGRDGEHQLKIEQGIEMGRPSSISVRIVVQGGAVEAIYLSGPCVPMMHGTLTLD